MGSNSMGEMKSDLGYGELSITYLFPIPPMPNEK